MSGAFGTTDDFDIDDQIAQQLAAQQLAIPQQATQGSTSQVVLQGVTGSQHAPTMSEDALTQALTQIVHRLAQQGEINEQLKTLLVAPTGGSSGLQLKLPHFYGKAGENVTTWIFQCESVFTAKGINDDRQRLHYVAGCLFEAALHWFQNASLEADEDNPAFEGQWTTFIVDIKKAFQPPHYQQILRRQLNTLKQSGHVQDYVYKFRNLVGQIEGMGQLDQVMHFVEGLKPVTRVEVNYRAPDTLAQAIDIAITYDTARFGPGRVTSSSSSGNSHQGYNRNQNYNQHQRHQGNDGPQPMELDNINRRNGNKHQNRMSDEEKSRLQREN